MADAENSRAPVVHSPVSMNSLQEGLLVCRLLLTFSSPDEIAVEYTGVLIWLGEMPYPGDLIEVGALGQYALTVPPFPAVQVVAVRPAVLPSSTLGPVPTHGQFTCYEIEGIPVYP